MKNTPEWNSKNVPMRTHHPLPVLSMEEHEEIILWVLKQWIRHDESFERTAVNADVVFSIFRAEHEIGTIELGTILPNDDRLWLTVHKKAHEQAIETFSHDYSKWPLDVRRASERMILFETECIRHIRDAEEKRPRTSKVDIEDNPFWNRNSYGVASVEKDRLTTKILFLAADPSNASRLRLGEELREIQEKLQLAQFRDNFELHQRMAVRPADVSQAMLDVNPDVVHFSGHGTSTGSLCFENTYGQIQEVSGVALSSLFSLFETSTKCVLLNACYSESQAKVISSHIDNVIGMNKAIGDKAAIAFAVGFYQALGAGRSIEDAYKFGCTQIQLQGIPGELTPVLHRRTAA